MDRLAGVIVGLIFFAALVGAYFAPTIVAGMRRHHQLGAIAVTNLFVGWTVIGWVVAMAMAASHTRAEAQPHPGNRPPVGTAPLWLYQTPPGEPPQERSA
jgi:hypothetical protein